MEGDESSLESCKVCGTTQELALILHSIRFRGEICFLCTNCLLKNHHGKFCPICFDAYGFPHNPSDTPSSHLHLMCLKCPSIVHRSCALDSSNLHAPVPDFHCPSCADPDFSYIKLDGNNPSINDAKNADGEGESVSVPAQNVQNFRAIDRESAKAIRAAARIAASSIWKVVAEARVEADRWWKEASLARKKVEEAKQRLTSLVGIELDAIEDSDSDSDADADSPMKRDETSLESCKVCGTTQEIAMFLHDICFRGDICRLCTNCLLKNHHGKFCPICFEIYNDPDHPSPHLHLMCLQCSSIVHSSCVLDSSNLHAPIPDFRCPSCADSNFSYFKLDGNNPSINDGKNADGEGETVSVPAQNVHNSGTPDGESAKAIHAAARIAVSSMREVVANTRIEAERWWEEAETAEQKVKEAMQRFASLIGKELYADSDSDSDSAEPNID